MLLHLRARLCAAGQGRAARRPGRGGGRPKPLLLLSTTPPVTRHPSRPPVLEARAAPGPGQAAGAPATTVGDQQPSEQGRGRDDDGDDGDDGAMDALELVLQVVSSMGAIDAAPWDAVAIDSAGGAAHRNPFVSHAFLLALEESGSAQPRTGWAPQHLLVRLRRRPGASAASASPSSPSSAAASSSSSLLLSGEGAVVGCAPVYLKGHSAGEYVFDQSWAEFHGQLGGRYYPKLLCGVPFTPVEGPRLMAGGPGLGLLARALLGARRRVERAAAAGLSSARGSAYTPEDARREAAAAVRRALASGLRGLAEEYRCSGAHVNFLPAHEQAELTKALAGGGGPFGGGGGDDGDDAGSDGSGGGGNGGGNRAGGGWRSGAFMPRFGWQYHWENRGYASFADFEADLKQSRRKSVRQERKGVAKQGLSLRRRRGSELSAAEWDAFHGFYQDTVDRRWGTAYLTRDFFARLGGEPALAGSVLMVTAHESGGGGGGPATAPGAAPAAVFRPPSAAPPSSSSFGGSVAGGLASLFGGGGGGKTSRGAASLPAGGLVAGALNFQGGGALYGRNWGAAPGRADAHPFLHFALCYYEAIEAAIESGLGRVEAGAQGEHKLQRGYLPALTRSAHLVRAADPAGAALEGAVARFLRGEARQVSTTWERLSTQASPFKEGTTAEVVSRRAREYLSHGGGAVPWELAQAAQAASSSASESPSSSTAGGGSSDEG